MSNEEKAYQIGELAKLVDLSARTIRYYEEVGLLNSIKRVEGGKRIYTNHDIRRLKFIKKLKLLGLSLAEMYELEVTYQKHKTNSKVLNKLIKLLDKHLGTINSRIKGLFALKKEISDYKDRMHDKLKDEKKEKK